MEIPRRAWHEELVQYLLAIVERPDHHYSRFLFEGIRDAEKKDYGTPAA